MLIVARCLFLFVACLSFPVFAGYSGNGQCFATIQEAVSRVAYYHNGICTTGDCRILSYVPTSGTAQVISQASILALSVSPCEAPDSVLPAYILPTPWYGSDPGTVSACGSTVNTTGGVSGGSAAGGAVQLAGWSMTPEEGAQIGVAVVSLFALAAVFKVLSKVGGSNSDD